MKTYQALIIEDEKPLAENLKRMVSEVDDSIQVIGIISTVRDAINFLHLNNPNLIFLDIQLSDGVCFNIFEKIKVHMPIIFTTAYDQYAIKAFKNNGIDYLLKPINKEELKQSIDKFKEINQLQDNNAKFESLLSLFSVKNEPYKKSFIVNVGVKSRIIEANEIAYFYALDKGVYIRTFNNKNYDIDYTLEKLSSTLDPDIFFRISRKYIINFKSIDEMITFSKGRRKLKLNPPTDDDLIINYRSTGKLYNWLNR
ncbi:MAG: DNA-binding response regulator [Bacteroidales bacterium]|nr:MAG: DNA-binding response regulator [Bacteroidales bacterium]